MAWRIGQMVNRERLLVQVRPSGLNFIPRHSNLIGILR